MKAGFCHFDRQVLCLFCVFRDFHRMKDLPLLEKRTCRNLYYLFYTRTRHPTFLYSAPHFFVLGTPLFVLGTPLFVLGTPLLAGEAHRLAVEELSPARLVSC